MCYIQEKDVYAIGGYLATIFSHPRCFLFEITRANSVSEAAILALEVAVQFLIEEAGCNDDDIFINSMP